MPWLGKARVDLRETGIKVCRHADGTPHKLGQGGYGQVNDRASLSLNLCWFDALLLGNTQRDHVLPACRRLAPRCYKAHL